MAAKSTARLSTNLFSVRTVFSTEMSTKGKANHHNFLIGLFIARRANVSTVQSCDITWIGVGIIFGQTNECVGQRVRVRRIRKHTLHVVSSFENSDFLLEYIRNIAQEVSNVLADRRLDVDAVRREPFRNMRFETFDIDSISDIFCNGVRRSRCTTNAANSPSAYLLKKVCR